MTDNCSTQECPQTGCVRLAMVNRAAAKVYLVDERMMDYVLIRSCFKNCKCLERMSLAKRSRACEKETNR